MRTSKYSFILRILLFIVMLASLLTLMEYLFLPVGADSAMMWQGYRKQKKLDVIFVGDSLCSNSLNPAVFDKIAGTSSFNMGTNSQSLKSSYLSIKKVIREKQIKHVVLMLNYPSLTDRYAYGPLKIQAAFWDAMRQNESIGTNLTAYYDFLQFDDVKGKPASLNMMMPWIYHHVNLTKREITQNIRDKRNKVTAYKKMNNKNTHYAWNGYKHIDYSINYNKIGNILINPRFTQEISRDSLSVLDSICRLCRENRVTLTVIYPPHPAFDVLSYGNRHFEISRNLEDFFRKREVNFFDFALVRPELLPVREEYFRDYEHMNHLGGPVFSKAFAIFWLTYQKGDDVSHYFYMPEEFLHSVRHISAVSYKELKVNGKRYLKGIAYTGPEVKTEFEYQLKLKGEKTFTTVQEYSSKSVFSLAGLNKGKYVIRINARKEGSHKKAERSFEKTVSI